MGLGLWDVVRSLVGSEIPPTPSMAHPPAAVHSPSLAVARALSCVGHGVYKLGAGGRNPEMPSPFIGGLCDCSGFALAWCQGLDRYQPGRIDGDYLWTDGVYADAKGPRRMFAEVALDHTQLGDCVVYRGSRTLGIRHPGHCGVIVAINGEGWGSLDVVDCHGGKAPAVGHRSGGLWGRAGGIVVRRVSG